MMNDNETALKPITNRQKLDEGYAMLQELVDKANDLPDTHPDDILAHLVAYDNIIKTIRGLIELRRCESTETLTRS